MAYFTYILQSVKSGRLYIGQTEDIEKRLARHNSNKNLSTKSKGPWEVIYFFEFSTRSEAVQLERKLKSWKNPHKVKEWIKVRKKME